MLNAQNQVVSYAHEEFGSWPARIIDVVHCLRQGQPLTLYQLRLFGAGIANTPSKSVVFSEEYSITPFAEPSSPPASLELRRAIGLAKRHLRFPPKHSNTNKAVRATPSALSEMEVENSDNLPEESPDTVESSFLMAWEDRKTAVNRLYGLTKKTATGRREAQDRALAIEQAIHANSADANNYWQLVSNHMAELRVSSMNLSN